MGHREKQAKTISREATTDSSGAWFVSAGMAERLAERAEVKLTSKNISKYERDRSIPYLKLYLLMLVLRMSQ
jgi:hypothetical protein